MGTGVVSSGDYSVSYFSEHAHVPRDEYLVAMVVWRRPPDPPRYLWHDVGRALRHLVGRTPRQAADAPSEAIPAVAREWDGSTGSGARQILCSSSRKALRVLGADLPLPADEQTLVVAVVEPGGPGTGHVAGRWVRRLPAIALHAPDRHAPPRAEAARVGASFQAAWSRWQAALAADPELRLDPVLGPFLASVGGRGAA